MFDMQQTATLEDTEWAQLMTIVGNTKEFPWVVTNPLLMKLGQQLQQQGQAVQMAQAQRGNGLDHDETPDLPDHVRRRGQRAPQ